VSTEEELRQRFQDACDNRCCHTLPPGASMDTSSACWEVQLTQKESLADSGGIVLHNFSRFVVVDVAAVNPLAMTPGDLRTLEGEETTRRPALAFFLRVIPAPCGS
jgi:hypothetical protein